MTSKPVDTAIVMVVGPLIDDTDFKSLEEAIAYNAAGMDISLIVEKTDGTSAVTAITLTSGGTSDWTHKDGGYYEVEVTATQNAEEGIAYLRGVCTGVLPFESAHYDIVKANIYDSLIKGTDKLQIDMTQCGGSTVAAGAIPNAAADAAGGLPISDVGGLDLDTKLANTNEITAARMGALTDWINGGRLDLILDIIAADTTTDIPALIAALNDISAANVNAEVVDVMKTDTTSEPSQGNPPATPTFEEMLKYVYFRMMNKNEETATEHAVYDAAGTTKVIKATVSDAAGTVTKGKFASGA